MKDPYKLEFFRSEFDRVVVNRRPWWNIFGKDEFDIIFRRAPYSMDISDFEAEFIKTPGGHKFVRELLNIDGGQVYAIHLSKSPEQQ